MAFTLTTTISSAVGANDTVIVVASATGALAGYSVKIDQEEMLISGGYVSGLRIPVRRAQNGSTVQTHPASAVVVIGPASEFASTAPQSTTSYPIAGRARVVTSYTGAGAITIAPPGNDTVAILNTTAGVAMTLADPGKDQDGDIIYVVAGGAAAFTVAAASGWGAGGGSYDVLTFAAGAQCAVWAIAANGAWCIPNSPAIAGTATNLLATIA